MPTTTITDRSAETPMPACATHSVELRLIVRGQLPEGIEAHHLLEYLQAYLGNREADLHEDIYDELEGLALECLGQEVSQKERQAKDAAVRAAIESICPVVNDCPAKAESRCDGTVCPDGTCFVTEKKPSLGDMTDIYANRAAED